MANTDILLAALIGKLPAGGTLWPAKKRAAWLELMSRAFDVVYELEEGAVAELPSFLAKPAAPEPLESPAAPAPAKALHPFVIDRDGYARRGTGEPVMPGQVVDVIYDERGELGDLGAIIWADGSTGVRGLTLEISAV